MTTTTTQHILVVLDVLIETTKLPSLKDAECDKENNTKNKWIDTTQYQVLQLKVTTCNSAANNTISINVTRWTTARKLL